MCTTQRYNEGATAQNANESTAENLAPTVDSNDQPSYQPLGAIDLPLSVRRSTTGSMSTFEIVHTALGNYRRFLEELGNEDTELLDEIGDLQVELLGRLYTLTNQLLG